MPDDRCLIFQRDRTILVTTASAAFPEARDGLRRLAELVHASGAYHTYRLTDLSLWSAVAGGMSSAAIIEFLDRFGEHAPPAPLIAYIQEFAGRYGLLRLKGPIGALRLESPDRALLVRIARDHRLTWSDEALAVPDERRGSLKSALAADGYPVIDEAGLAEAAPLAFRLRPDVVLRPYQEAAATRFVAHGGIGGVVLLPCGSGKTVVGVAIAAQLAARTLVRWPTSGRCSTCPGALSFTTRCTACRPTSSGRARRSSRGAGSD